MRLCVGMETAIRGRLSLSPNSVFNPKPGEKQSLYRGPYTNRGVLMAISTEDQLKEQESWRSQLEREPLLVVNLGMSRKIAPSYRVILHNDNYNKREYVVQVLMK